MKNTFLVNGGAMPKINRGALIRRAWAIFRQTYKYALIKFSDIGRKCFAWGLRRARTEAGESAWVAAMSARARAERVELLQILISLADYIDDSSSWRTTVAAYRQEIRLLLPARVTASQ
jgi:hypothetical protein